MLSSSTTTPLLFDPPKLLNKSQFLLKLKLKKCLPFFYPKLSSSNCSKNSTFSASMAVINMVVKFSPSSPNSSQVWFLFYFFYILFLDLFSLFCWFLFGYFDFEARISVDVVKKYLQEKIYPKLLKKGVFSVLYIHTGVDRGQNFPGISALRSIFDDIPPSVQSNLETVYFLHPGLQSRLFLATFGRLFISSGYFSFSFSFLLF